MTYYKFQASVISVKNVTHQTIGGAININHQDGEAEDIDRTNNASTRMRRKQGLPDAGSLTFDLQNDPEDAGQARLLVLKGSGAVEEFKWVVGSRQFTANGYVKSFSFSAETAGDWMGSVVVRLTGAPVSDWAAV